MKKKIINLLGGELIFEINYPEELKDKEEIQTERVVNLISRLLQKEFSPTENEISELVVKDLC